MKRAIRVLLATAAFSMVVAVAQADDEDVYKEWTTKVTLHRAAETRPSLKYQLLPPRMVR